ncbi:hypothetical protein FACS189442_3230 [Spirochaetia bacterium]|nr:hypothetical protein FACS189442_3230 [Spirochaetia bacterium]
MDEKDSAIFERMAKAQERIATAIDKQQPGRFSQAIVTGAAVATALGLLNVVDIIIKWIGG